MRGQREEAQHLVNLARDEKEKGEIGRQKDKMKNYKKTSGQRDEAQHLMSIQLGMK